MGIRLSNFTHQFIEAPIINTDYQNEAAVRSSLRDWVSSMGKENLEHLGRAQFPRDGRTSQDTEPAARTQNTQSETLIMGDVICEKLVRASLYGN